VEAVSDTQRIVVLHASGDRFVAQVRDHVVVTDQPRDAGGDDVGPTPTELFVTGLASCIAFYAERFLRRHQLPVEGLRVECTFEMGERPARVDSVGLHVSVPAELPPSEEAALKAVIDNCTVHNSLRHPPSVRMSVASRSQAA
jgi:putative redox protein